MRPMAETRYAQSGEISIAYQVTGDGPFDVVMIPGSTSHGAYDWEVPVFRTVIEHLSSFCRLIRFDKRGTGMSDRTAGLPDLETRMDDVRAVMDAAGSERAALCGISEGGPMSLLFAATYPDRVWALALYGSFARYMVAPDYPWGSSEAEYLRSVTEDRLRFGEPGFLEAGARHVAPNAPEEEIRALAEHDRYAGSPGADAALSLMNMRIDVRGVLGSIRVPTLVLHRNSDTSVKIEEGRYLAERIPGARLIEVPGEGHVGSAAEAVPWLEEVEGFLRHVWETSGSFEAEPERALATILFTDIVGSTERAISMGDRPWRELLEHHHAVVRRELLRFRGTEVDTAGDGFLASFDGPARAIRCACSIRDAVGELGLQIRAGLHTGECEIVDGKVAGIAVHTGARVAALAAPDEVLVSSTVRDLVAGSGIEFADGGEHELKGLPERWHLYRVADRHEPAAR